MTEKRLVRGEVPRLAREAGQEIREVWIDPDEMQELLREEVVHRMDEVLRNPGIDNAAELHFYLGAYLRAHGISDREIDDMLDVRRINLGGVNEIVAVER